MRVTSSYKVEIVKLHKPLAKTMRICRSAVSYLLPVIDGEWEYLSSISREKARFNAAEKLIHETQRNTAKYPFDAAYPKMPSYLRRAILRHVLGAVSSIHTREGLSRDASKETGSGYAAVASETLNVDDAPEYYDFYIRTCWYAPGSNDSSTISTTVRLFNPDL